MSWRDVYKVHPAADVFPMMDDTELAALGEDIEENGLRDPIKLLRTGKEKKAPEFGDNVFTQPVVILDGRNRLEAMERAGWNLDGCRVKWQYVNGSRGPFPPNFDAVAYVISANIKRRHLTKAQQADLIVAALKAGAPRKDCEMPKRHVKGKAGSEKDPLKAEAVKVAAEHGIGKRTVETAIAKAEGRTPKPRPARVPEPENETSAPVAEVVELDHHDDDDDEVAAIEPDHYRTAFLMRREDSQTYARHNAKLFDELRSSVKRLRGGGDLLEAVRATAALWHDLGENIAMQLPAKRRR